ncbi:MAG: type II secretion system F family protein [Actinomycetia bacterium]|nr:type II secretion system F family protein [Actinomycetes bacterium]
MPSELVVTSESFLAGLGVLGMVAAGRALGWWQPARRFGSPHRSSTVVRFPTRGARSSRRSQRLAGWAVLAVAVAVAVGSLSPLLGMIAPAAVGGAAWRRSRARQRHEAERAGADLPEVADLLAVAASAGLTPHTMLDLLTGLLPANAAVAELAEARNRAARGGILADELDSLGLARPQLGALTSALAGAERFGAALEPALVMAARDARVGRRHRIEEQARRLPVRLLFPLVVCVLPAFVLLTVVPVLAATVGDLVG